MHVSFPLNALLRTSQLFFFVPEVALLIDCSSSNIRFQSPSVLCRKRPGFALTSRPTAGRDTRLWVGHSPASTSSTISGLIPRVHLWYVRMSQHSTFPPKQIRWNNEQTQRRWIEEQKSTSPEELYPYDTAGIGACMLNLCGNIRENNWIDGWVRFPILFFSNMGRVARFESCLQTRGARRCEPLELLQACAK
jgi:hypothetical protein